MEEHSSMKRVEIEENREENELMLELELSIGGIFGKKNDANKNLSESIEKHEIQGQGRRGVCRKRDEKVINKMVGSGSCGSISNELLENEIVGQNDDVLEIEHVRKKEKITNVMKNAGSVLKVPITKDSCSSHQGGATDDSRSNSSNSQIDQQVTTTSTSSDPFDPSVQPTCSAKQTISTNKLSEPSLVKPINQSNPHDQSSVSNPPSKIDTSSHQQQASFLARMPCVSTTGNGPNGKTISGFLHRYTKNEVSIVCVCHGRSFSPAGFVEHAGGVDIVHPLKHITIFPTAFT
ncbi:ninja family, Jas TPL-binding domain protein [Artemisia annua]|uniref:Ninja-family protein n=1 Tax=Artemisia annua TaxID=35608 RepID=A0A2U1L5B6_ARTAN|nr:ninja family, Jas TPL-binding domain protein [Artemisia annua]